MRPDAPLDTDARQLGQRPSGRLKLKRLAVVVQGGGFILGVRVLVGRTPWPPSRPPATCSEFRRAFGESPHAYLLTRRLERAAALLRHTYGLVRVWQRFVQPITRS